MIASSLELDDRSKASSVLLDIPPHGYVSAQDETWHHRTDHEGQHENEGVVDARGHEGPAVLERAPNRKATENECRRRGVPLRVAKGCPQKRNDR